MPKLPPKTVKTDGQSQNTQPDPNYDEQIKALKLKIAELEGIQSAMPDPYYVRDMDYNILIWPESIARLTGYSEAEAKKLKCYEMFKAAVCPPNCDCPTQQCIKTKQFLRDVAVDVYHKGGDAIHTLVSNAGIYDEEGNVIGAVEIVKDNSIVHKSMASISQIIKNIEGASTSLNLMIDNLEVVSKKVTQGAHESLESIKTGVEAGKSVSEKAGKSSTYAGNVQGNMVTINESMKFSMDKISALKEKSELIIEFVKMIQEIASKTNLLAINASIEAAHAGESGRGFKVVADGIRELSKNSSESAQSIKATVQEVIRLVQEATASLNVTEKDIESGTNTISGLLTFVSEIDDAAKMLLNNMDTIENAAVITSKLEDEQNATVVEVDRVCSDLSNIAKSMTEEFDNIFKAILHHADMA